MRIPLCAILLLAVSEASAQNTTVAGRTQDLNFVANQLPLLHVNFFYQLSPATYQQAAAALGARIGTATDPEFYVGLEQLIALAGDMHTTMSPEDVFYNYGYLPLAFVWLEDGLFVTTAAPEYSQALATPGGGRERDADLPGRLSDRERVRPRQRSVASLHGRVAPHQPVPIARPRYYPTGR